MKKLIITIMTIIIIMIMMAVTANADSYKLINGCGNTLEFVAQQTGLNKPTVVTKGCKLQTSKNFNNGSWTLVNNKDDGTVEIISFYQGKCILSGTYKESE